MQRHAVIIGAGIAGLATAVGLRAQGWSVDIHERAAGLPEGGTALGMWPEAMDALEALGVAPAVRSHAAVARGGALLRPDGAVLGRISPSVEVHLVSRGRLLSALHDALPPGTVRWSSPLRASDIPLGADLVVGADGIHSAVRQACWPTAGKRPLGTVAFRGVVPGVVAGVTETWGRGALFGITPSSDERTNWFACLPLASSPGAGPGVAEALRERFAAWHPGVLDIVSRLEDAEVDRRELFDVQVPGRFVHRGVALVGDAAHAMAPNLGRGACESLIDAVALARAAGTAADVSGALARYDRARRRRARRVVRAARLLNGVATARRGTPLRDAAVRLVLPGGAPAVR
jgi:2-polyprenyl-6-methoxyphenol hydroxylase-like FAD-dependent oxidoreductase